MTLQSDDACYKALQGRDARFDGCFFTAVTSTGIYCRPVCKVRAPKRENCRFFEHAAQAESAGFRPCMRCRPELAPRSLLWSIQDASHTLALQAAHLWDEPMGAHSGPGDRSAVDYGWPSVADVAHRLGVSDRHLRRIFETHLGVSPLQYLQTRRLLTAKQLLTDTRMAVADVAMASGFDSVRRFNAVFVEHYRFSPLQLRKQGALGSASSASPCATAHASTHAASIQIKLPYRPPYDVQSMVDFGQKRQIHTIEIIAACAHPVALTRSFGIQIAEKYHAGWVTIRFDEVRSQVLLELSDNLLPALPTIIARSRAALDLDADPQAINAVLGAHFPDTEGLRVPGALDGFEVAIRAIVGQQVTVAAGRTFTQRLVDTYGAPISTPWPELSKLFPTPQTLAQADPAALGALGIVRQRQAAIIALSQAVAQGQINLNTCARALQTVEQLKTLPGIGDWTAQYIAMRALRWPDAFPAGDVALHNALGVRGEKSPAKAAETASQAWRPWRSYAVLRAWQKLQTPGTQAGKLAASTGTGTVKKISAN